MVTNPEISTTLRTLHNIFRLLRRWQRQNRYSLVVLFAFACAFFLLFTTNSDGRPPWRKSSSSASRFPFSAASAKHHKSPSVKKNSGEVTIVKLSMTEEEHERARRGMKRMRPDDNHDMLLRNPKNGRSLSELMGYNSRKGNRGATGVVGGQEIKSGEHILVHLDLKGAPPKMSYLRKLLPLLKELGATGLLVEYEDTFPFGGTLSKYTSLSEWYSEGQLKQLLAAAKQHNMVVIPLVQTFGHMEWILKHGDFGTFREDPRTPQSLCPSNPDSLGLVKSIIDEVMAIHNESNWLHLGGDEVHVMAQCRKCQDRMKINTWTKDDLYLDFIQNVAEYVKNKYDVQPIIWDDMLRKVPIETLRASKLGELVEPMLWAYTAPYLQWIPGYLDRYQGIFKYVWGASAFKGGDFPDYIFPNYGERIRNNHDWVKIMKDTEKKTSLSFRGVVLTGWQRFTHFSVLCELLPTSLPILGIALQIVKGSAADSPHVIRYLSDIFECPGLFETITRHSKDNSVHPEEYTFGGQPCSFPGAQVFSLMLQLRSAMYAMDSMEDEWKFREHFNEYNAKYNFGIAYEQARRVETIKQLVVTIQQVIQNAPAVLSEVYGIDTIQEIMESRMRPQLRRAQKWLNIGVNLTAGQEIMEGYPTWRSRPIHRSGPNVGHLAEDL